MTIDEAKKIIKSECYIADLLNLDRTQMVNTALDLAIKALDQISHLKDRPCEACEFHTGDGCSKWECVFEGSDKE